MIYSLRCTLYMLKTLLGSMTTDNLREDQIRLICNNIVIEDDRLISSYGITNGTVIHLVFPMRIPFDNFSDRNVF